MAELAHAISDLTEGNAFVVCELWRALVDTNSVEIADGTLRLSRPLTDLGRPSSVREVVSRRLARLRPATSDLLELAADGGHGVRASRSCGPPRTPATFELRPRWMRPCAAG